MGMTILSGQFIRLVFFRYIEDTECRKCITIGFEDTIQCRITGFKDIIQRYITLNVIQNRKEAIMAFWNREDPDEQETLEKMIAEAPAAQTTSLSAHAGTARVEESAVKAIPEPPFTKTWNPVSHARVIDTLEHACKDTGLNIMARDYSLNVKGTRMFGVWDLDYKTNGSCYSLGFRNSIDKSMVVGVVGGFRVFVCDNLALSGDYLTFHKHTSGLDEKRLNKMAKEALIGAWDDMERLESWINSLQNHQVSSIQFKELTFNLMKAKVFPPSQFEKFLISHEEERGPRVFSKDITGKNLATWYDKDTCLHTVHGACTRLMRGQSLFKVADANKRLHGVCDEYIQLAA
jgi:hypothetical protein